MANREACEVWIEQEIDSGLKEGKAPYSIGKEISEWLVRKFETYISPKTIETRANRQREKITSNEVKKSETHANSPSSQDDLNDEWQEPEQYPKNPQSDDYTFKSGRGGSREGAGRKKSLQEKLSNLPIDKEKITSVAFTKAFDVFLTEIENAKAMEWKTTSKESALAHVKILYDVITFK